MKKIALPIALFATSLAVAANLTRAEKIRAKLDSNDRNYVFVTMHRGDWRHAPENSSAAILGAIAMGADVVELDVAPTKDGHFVLLHDGSLDRVSTGKGNAKDLTLAEIKQYRLKDGKTGQPTEYEVLTLEEAFALTRGRILVNLDKYNRDPKGITELTVKLGVEREVVYKGSFRPDRLKTELGAELWDMYLAGRLFYMPILSIDNKEEPAKFEEWQSCGRAPSAYELCFGKESPCEVMDRLSALPTPAPRIWINTMWEGLCAGHDDERGHEGDVGSSWGWCLRRGATMIQTDRPEDLIRYLDSLGRHDLDRPESAAPVMTSLMPALFTIPHEMDDLVKHGHIQGAAGAKDALYLSHAGGVYKIDWKTGHVLKSCVANGHLGDIAFGYGRIYGACSVWDPAPGKTKLSIVVWDKDLNQIAEKVVQYPGGRYLDGLVVLDDTLYVGVDHYGEGRWGCPPHKDCTVMLLSVPGLEVKGTKDVEFDYTIRYGVQCLSTDGMRILFANYGGPRGEGNPNCFNFSRADKNLNVIDNGQFPGYEGFSVVPMSVFGRDELLFCNVNALGGNMQGWRKDPENNPPRLRIDFYSYDPRTGRFTDMTLRR